MKWRQGVSLPWRRGINLLWDEGVNLRGFSTLYAETEKFLDWIKADSSNHFINIYTDQGGTVNETNNMMNQMALQNIPYRKVEESDLIPLKLKNDHILIIHSLREHDYIINDPDNFYMFITNSPFLHK